MMATVRRGLERAGVPQREQEITPADVAGLAGAVVLNSWTPGVAVHRIGETTLPEAPAFMRALHEAHESEPPAEP